MRIARKLTALALVATLTLGAGLLTACGKTDEEVVHDGIADVLEAVKNQEVEFVDKVIATLQLEQLGEFGIDAHEFMKAYLADFDYAIENVAVNEEAEPATAVATVRITAKDYASALQSASDSLVNDPGLGTLTEEQLYERIRNAVFTALADAPLQTSEPFEITYELHDTVWTPTEDAQNVIANALLGGE